MEARFPEPSIFPRTPCRLFVSNLLEAWADEWWVSVAMHTRWSNQENYTLFQKEAGDHLLPYAPRAIKNMAVDRVASVLRSYLPGS
jgi:hypothetical protein